MRKIKEMNTFFVHNDFYYASKDFPFLDWIYSQCNSKDITYIDKTWFKCPQTSPFNSCLGMLYDLFYRNGQFEKFLYL
jgi:hypothetical protein